MHLPDIATQLAEGINDFFSAKEGGKSPLEQAAEAAAKGLNEIIDAFIDFTTTIKLSTIRAAIVEGINTMINEAKLSEIVSSIGKFVIEASTEFLKLFGPEGIDFQALGTKLAEGINGIFHDEKGRNIYQTINMVPVKDKEGNITSYFGMARNDTEMHYTEALLEEETKKAQETEELKNTFLTNMSYEIRTPLNAVLGFAELFNGPHDEADEPVFAEEIKRNTGDLLKLVNDILFISRLDAKMVEFNYKESDFAASFEGYCYIGFSVVNPDVNVSVENPYSQLLLNIDEQNLGEVISKMCAISAASTKEGNIRAKCEYRHGELTISIEDTSEGMDKNSLSHLFDRFANDFSSERTGTGLEMPIIKGLIEQMGGSIEVQSEQGKGTAVYVIIPCEMIKMEKK